MILFTHGRVEVIRILAGQIVRFAAMAASPFSLAADSWLKIHTTEGDQSISIDGHEAMPVNDEDALMKTREQRMVYDVISTFSISKLETMASLNMNSSMVVPDTSYPKLPLSSASLCSTQKLAEADGSSNIYSRYLTMRELENTKKQYLNCLQSGTDNRVDKASMGLEKAQTDIKIPSIKVKKSKLKPAVT
uniref:Uncharacterized protein n=1 Tax=Tanacetum cinerariifolium TaxID=118510 RepID=A0A6L2LSH4_TANCI|nr:hypothetical protein [Tanacetum cinerariifolium]